jgi:hypothetical protein
MKDKHKGYDFCESWDCDREYCLKLSKVDCKGKAGSEKCLFKLEYRDEDM